MDEARMDEAKEKIELVGIIAVVLSLLFVGYEIRQNTIVARAAAYQSIGVATASVLDNTAHDLRYQEIYLKSPEELTQAEWGQLVSKMNAWARLAETVLLQIEQGLLPPDAMERLGYRSWKTILEDPTWRACAWPHVRKGVSDAFREYVEDSQDSTDIDCSVFPSYPSL